MAVYLGYAKGTFEKDGKTYNYANVYMGDTFYENTGKDQKGVFRVNKLKLSPTADIETVPLFSEVQFMKDERDRVCLVNIVKYPDQF